MRLYLSLFGLMFVALVLSNALAQNIDNSNFIKLEIIEPWKPVTVKLLEPDSGHPTEGQYKISEITASVADYKFSDRPKSGMAALSSKFPILKIHVPNSRKIYFVDPEHTFYIFDGNELNGYTVGPGVLVWSSSYLASAESEGDSTAIARFENSFNNQMLNDAWDKRNTNRIGLSEAAPQFYFSDGPYPGGATPMPEVVAASRTNNILRLNIRNPATKIVGDFWINLKEKKVTKSIVDSREMNLNTGKPFAVPLKK